MTGMGTELRLRQGEWPLAEEQALEILQDERRAGSKAIKDKNDWLTPDQLKLRQDREVLNQNGVPDGRLLQGIYHRSYNPMMGRRPKHWWSQVRDPDFDARVPHGSSTTTGGGGLMQQWPRFSAWWADHDGDWHLDRYQRCRIRKAYRAADGPAREAIKVMLAEKYGVPPWVVSRVAISSRTCHT